MVDRNELRSSYLEDKPNPDTVIKKIKDTLLSVYLNFLEHGKKETIEAKLMTSNYELVMKITENEECNQKMFDGYKALIKEYIEKYVKPVIEDKEGEELLSVLAQKWDNLKIVTYVLTRVFRYLDRFFVKNRNTGALTQIAFNLFREQVFDNHKHKLTQTFLNQIDKCRSGYTINKTSMKQVLDCYAYMGYVVKDIEKKQQGVFKFESLVVLGDEDLHYYLEYFEKEFLKFTSESYKAKSAAKLAAEDVPNYIKWCLQMIKEEKQRADDYLHLTTKNKLIKCVTTEIIVNHLAEITENPVSGCEHMFKNKLLDQLKDMYQAFEYQSADTMKHISKHFEPYIVERGRLLIEDVQLQKKPVQMVDKLMEFKDEIDNIVSESFSGYNEFQQCRMKAFYKFMNQNDYPTVWIAQWCHDFMINTCKGKGQEEVVKLLDKVVDLFLRTDGRDQFIIKYSELLSQRLINNESANDTYEETMINKLKYHVGQASVSKLITMKNDLQLSKKLWENFVESGEDEKNVYELNVRVLTKAQWPIKNQEEVRLNTLLTSRIVKFSQFYRKRYEGRKINYCSNYGEVELKLLYCDKNYIMTGTVLMANVLLLFNQHAQLTFKQVIEEITTDCTEDFKDELECEILGMCNPKKAQVLKKQYEKKANLTLDEVLTVNKEFAHKFLKFTCHAMGSKKKSEKEKATLNSYVKQERQMQLDAKLVKVFKARKTISETDLVGEILKLQFMWRPTQNEILQRLTNLIEDKEWVERDANNNKLYHYVA